MTPAQGVSPFHTMALWFRALEQRIAQTYDRIYTHEREVFLERLIVYLAVAGFLIHLSLIFLCSTVPGLAAFRRVFGTNYLSAIYTPFSFILFFEMLLLVLTIPESTTRAVGTQFEIISLITLRNVFKDLAAFENLSQIAQQIDDFIVILTDMGGGLLLFLLVAVFYHISSRRTAQEQAMGVPTRALEHFIARKKIIALGLSFLLFSLVITSLAQWVQVSYLAVVAGTPPLRSFTTLFSTDLFTVIIFTDVLILILSLLLSNNYQLVFRNAGFVVATILLRISLSADKPYDIIVALIATVFGILVLLIYKYCSRIGASHEMHPASDIETS